MSQINPLDTVDCIDAINAKLDQAEGILCTLEITLSISDMHHHKLPHAVTAAMGFIAESRQLVKDLGTARDYNEIGEEFAQH
ncbi:hypothetical protein G6Z94_11700 [Vibrio aestuarianus]|uniref:hypothetical protein n=1 Tax=Vibrio aestuarianus TaxID=28171 RepID=UPI001594CEF8|nr:hypothetical protein [Vibrio aestuarianus]NGZ18003.1 hypothetical protein [Vibrio aestuarianus]